MYLQCPSNNSKTAIIISYVVCLLYVLSTATLFIDVLTLIFEVSNNFICLNILFLSVTMQTRTIDATSQLLIDSFRLLIIQVLVNSLADFIAQSILVRICTYNHHPFYSSESSLAQDLPLLDRVGTKYICHHHSCIFGNHILWLVKSS